METIFPYITSNDEVVERHYFLGKLLSARIIHLFWWLYLESFAEKITFMGSVKPFISKNRDKIYLDASNPNLNKGCDRDFLATA